MLINEKWSCHKHLVVPLQGWVGSRQNEKSWIWAHSKLDCVPRVLPLILWKLFVLLCSSECQDIPHCHPTPLAWTILQICLWERSRNTLCVHRELLYHRWGTQNYESESLYMPPTSPTPMESKKSLLPHVLQLFGMWADGSITPDFIHLWKVETCRNKPLPYSKVFFQTYSVIFYIL